MWQFRIKVRVPALNWERVWWLGRGGRPLGNIWVQIAVAAAVFGFDLEIARK